MQFKKITTIELSSYLQYGNQVEIVRNGYLRFVFYFFTPVPKRLLKIYINFERALPP